MIDALNATTAASQPAYRAGAGNVPAHPTVTRDTVTIRAPHLMSDAEAAQAMDTVQQTVEHNPGEALSVHSGLEYDRVMTLLGMG